MSYMSTQNELNNETSQVLDRISKVLNCDSVTSLAKALGVAQTTVSNWRVRNSVPFQHCVDISKRVGVSLDWLLTGKGDMYQMSNDSLSPQEQALLNMFRDLPEGDRRKVVDFVEDKKRFDDIARRLNQLLQLQTQKTA